MPKLVRVKDIKPKEVMGEDITPKLSKVESI